MQAESADSSPTDNTENLPLKSDGPSSLVKNTDTGSDSLTSADKTENFPLKSDAQTTEVPRTGEATVSISPLAVNTTADTTVKTASEEAKPDENHAESTITVPVTIKEPEHTEWDEEIWIDVHYCKYCGKSDYDLGYASFNSENGEFLGLRDWAGFADHCYDCPPEDEWGLAGYRSGRELINVIHHSE